MATHPCIRLALCLAMAAACLVNLSCTGTPTRFHAVTLMPKGPIVIGSGGSQAITASVLNDSSGAGVNWATPTHGTLAAVTTTSATYDAPVIAAGGSVSDTVTATSVSFPTNSATLSITVEGAPVISTTSLPAGNQGTPYSATVSASGGVSPFTWSLSAGSLPTGLALGGGTTNSVMISGTPSAQGTFNFTIKIADSSGGSGTQALSITIGAPLPLQVTTTSLPNGALNAPYPSTILQASGGVPPLTWSVTLGALPAGLTLATGGTISGTPTVTGTFSFTVQVTDSEVPAKTATGNLSITVNNLGILKGNYAFLFSGFNANDAVAIGGSFTADGLGNLTNGVEDFNSTASSSYKNQTFTGTYTLGSDNRGVLTFSSLEGSPAFAFAIDPTGAHGRIIEFDSSGIRGSGQIELRAVSTCASNTLNGQYAFGVSGQVVASASSTAGPAVAVGSFLATPPTGSGTGSVSNTEDDANTPGGVVTQDQSWGGSFQTTAQSTRCTITLSPRVGQLTYSVYPVSTNEAFLVESDQVTSTQPFLTSGKLLLQTGFPFNGGTGSVFTGVSISGLTGELLRSSAYVPDMALIELTGSSSANYSMSITENVAGAVTTNPVSGTFLAADQFGRLDSGFSAQVHPVFYMVDDNEGFCIGEILNNPFFGIFEPQSPSPFSITASDLNATFVLGTSSPATSAVANFSGSVTLANTSTSAGTISGTQDQSTSSANTAGQGITGTYTGLNSSTGTGAVSLTRPATSSGDFVVVSPTKIVILSTTAGDTNPVVIYLGDCASTCGED